MPPPLFELWQERACTWPPFGTTPLPEAELLAFLTHSKRWVGRSRKADVLATFEDWAACMRTLADNPFVMLREAAAEHIVGGTLAMLHKVGIDETDDAVLLGRCTLAERWCAEFLRSISGAGCAPGPSFASRVDAAFAFEADALLIAQRHAMASSVVRELRAARSSPRRTDSSGGGGPATVLAPLAVELAKSARASCRAAWPLVAELCQHGMRLPLEAARALLDAWAPHADAASHRACLAGLLVAHPPLLVACVEELLSLLQGNLALVALANASMLAPLTSRAVAAASVVGTVTASPSACKC